ncbi:Poly(ADP-ribose) glycohydrolase 1 [Platanthera zijinensis]|uniref:Poly(ADP-ribose) glycohydrolase 1 n=1 Tax=Platanthera zijinensis TaxID=2320716 RepID=A0AAP0BTU1_9ASPA
MFCEYIILVIVSQPLCYFNALEVQRCHWAALHPLSITCDHRRCDMERREDLKSILPLLPFILRSSSLFWPSKALESLKALALGPDLSRVSSGEILFDAIVDIRDSLGLSHERLASHAGDGYSLFFDELMSRMDSRAWFGEVVPKLATLLLQLPSLLEAHYLDSDEKFGEGRAGLRLIDQQEAGIVILSQELVSALLACALFCLYPTSRRAWKSLPIINFDHLFGMQEEIRFMISPELIIGMLFMVSMSKNEAIEIIGSERFSCYMGYGSSFRFVGDYVDRKLFDTTRRRRTRIIAIDALHSPGKWQYGVDCLVREINKAYCGFFDQSKCYMKNLEAFVIKSNLSQDDASTIANNAPYVYSNTTTHSLDPLLLSSSKDRTDQFNLVPSTSSEAYQENVGIATGNWGCGAFGGDPEIKSVIQWLAASQALRPFMHYYTFGANDLQKLNEVCRWILSHGWTVGDLWDMLVDYCTQRLNKETSIGFFSWLLPQHNSAIDKDYMSE